MNNDLDTNPLVSPEERMVTLGIKAAALVAITLLVGMVSCSMHSNAYEADVTSAEAKVEAERVKIVAAEMSAREAESKVEIEKINAMERMIQSGANPVAIRCMDKGWKDNSTCLAIGLAFGNAQKSTEE